MDDCLRTVKTMDLLRKKDLHPKVGVPKSTVADWITEFNVYIPKVKEGNVIYYKPEIIDVLLFIKDCREKNYQKPQIMQLLSDKGFPVTVEEAVEDVQKVSDDYHPRDHLLTIMQTMGQAVTKISEQDESLKSIQERQDGQNERLDELEKRTQEVHQLKQELDELKQQFAATQEKKKNGWLSRLFGKGSD